MVRSELQNLYGLAEKHDKKIKGLKSQLINAAAGLSGLNGGVTKLNYTLTLRHMALNLDADLNDYHNL